MNRGVQGTTDLEYKQDFPRDYVVSSRQCFVLIYSFVQGTRFLLSPVKRYRVQLL